jgi:hypothetical protein
MESKKFISKNNSNNTLFKRRLVATAILISTLSLVTPPIPVKAVEVAPAAIAAFKNAITVRTEVDKAKPKVPTSNPEDNTRNFLTSLAITIAQRLVNRMVDSTISWANSGFEGGPAFAVNPGEYFRSTISGEVGNFIIDNDYQFLCSPFQRSVRVSLLRSYGFGPDYTPNYQCTLSDIKGNIDDFFDGSFNAGGGWDSWLQVTQNPANNPYGSFLTAKLEVDQRIAQKIGIQKMELDWGGGFLSVKYCRDRDRETGQCKEWGSTKTPGSLIQSGVDKHLGTELAQLMDVKRFDQLLGALMNGLMQKYIFNKGFFRSDYRVDLPPFQGIPPIDPSDTERPPAPGSGELTCAPSQTLANIGDTVTWTALSTLPNVEYFWILDGEPVTLSTTGPNISVMYNISGIKSGLVTASWDGGAESAASECSTPIIVFPSQSTDDEGPSLEALL